MNKWLKIGLVALVSLAAVFAFGNAILNVWLQNWLPGYVRNHTDYRVAYDSFSVELASGRIRATGLKVETEKRSSDEVVAIEGTVDTLTIGGIGLWDAVFNQKVSPSALVLAEPKLTITLPRPKAEKKGKKEPVAFGKVAIRRGTIVLNRHNGSRFLSVRDLDLSVRDFSLTEQGVENRLPVVFDEYSIRGKSFFFRSDNVYAFTASEIRTDGEQMQILDFRMIPLLSHRQFMRYYPAKRNLFEVRAEQMRFKGLRLKDNRLAFSQVDFISPDVSMYTMLARPEKKKKSFGYVVDLEDLLFEKAKLRIFKPDGSVLFSAGDLKLKVSRLKMDDETAKGSIPIAYDDFSVVGRNFYYKGLRESVKLGAAVVSPSSAELRRLVVAAPFSKDLKIEKIALKVHDWGLVESKFKLNAKSLLVDGVSGELNFPAVPKNKRSSNKGAFVYPLKIGEVKVDRVKLALRKAGAHRSVEDLSVRLKDLEVNEKTLTQALPFSVSDYLLSVRRFRQRAGAVYGLDVEQMRLEPSRIQIGGMVLRPLVSRSQFVKMIPTERDLYDLKIRRMEVKGRWDLFSKQPGVNAEKVLITGLDANVFRSKLPPDDERVKPMYSELLRDLDFPLFVADTEIKDSKLVYEEDTEKSDGPGKLLFDALSIRVKDLHSGKVKKGKIPITVSSRFMGVSPMNVLWVLDTGSSKDAFSIKGSIVDLPASGINPFVEPYLKIRTSGYIHRLDFDFQGDKKGINGRTKISHKDLKVAILKQDGERNKLLSTVANWFVKTNAYSEDADIGQVDRDKTKSFFNLLWQGLQSGLKKTLIGGGSEKTEQGVRKAVEAVKNTAEQIKENMQSVIAPEVDSTTAEKKSSSKPRKGLRAFFRKKKTASSEK